MKKPILIALIVGMLGINPAFAQFSQGGGPFGNGGGFQQGSPFGNSYGGGMNSGYPGMNSGFGGYQSSPYAMNPASQMGWLGGMNNGGLYNQIGGPVAGAQMMNPYMMQQAGSGQMMLNQCPYAQSQIVDPINDSTEVTDAKDQLAEAIKARKEAKEKLDKANEALKKAKEKLVKDLIDGTMAGVNTLLETAKACDKFTNGPLKEFSDKATKEAPTSHSTEFVEVYKNEPTLSGETAKTACYKASAYIYQNNKYVMVPRLLCMSIAQEIKAGDSTSNARAPEFKSGPNAYVEGPGKNCGGDLANAYDAQKDIDLAEAELTRLKTEEKEKYDAIGKARKQVAHDLAQERKEAALEAKYDEAAGVPADIATCPDCVRMYQQQVQKPSRNNAALVLGAIGGIGISALNIGTSNALKRGNQQLGFVANPLTSSNTAIWGNGIANGLSTGLPFMMSGLYGQTPGGGYVQGGYGCAPTINGSQFGQGQGPFNNGMYNGAYYPGAAYMPGAGNWGVNGMPGMFPGGGMYPGGGGMMNPGGGMYPGGGGMMNPYGMQMQQQQMQMAFMSQQMQDQMRAQQGAMSAIGYGLNNANQQYSYASSLLGGSYGGGGYGYGGGGYGYGGGGYGYGGGGFNNYMGGNYMGGFAPIAGPCGGGMLTASISICGNIPLGGGSYYPTNSNSYYGGGSQYQYPQFNNATINAGGFIR